MNPNDLKPGDVVRLINLKGPRMLVEWVNVGYDSVKKEKITYAECFWFDNERRRHWHKFNPLLLELDNGRDDNDVVA